MSGFALVMVAGSVHAETIDSLAWLQGCWGREGKSVVEENWMAPRGGSMIVVSRTTRDGLLITYELILLHVRDGALIYEAHPSGQDVAEFRVIEMGEGRVVFENSVHDFPQRIGYRAVGSDSLYAWIEGEKDGKTRRLEFPYARVSCADAPRH
jgi:hypothetical protein